VTSTNIDDWYINGCFVVLSSTLEGASKMPWFVLFYCC